VRLRASRAGIKGKDGNPLNEVRMLSNSILLNGGVLAAKKTIKYKPQTSVLKLKIGEKIALTQTEFAPLADAFFSEIEANFV
jgi:hypothetical protein